MENIEVALRVRPINTQELENNDIEIWNTAAGDEIGISTEQYSDLIRMRKIAPGQKTQYFFNRCFDQNTSNTLVYDQVVKRIALSSLKGINGTVFMYGQTGSGKTFTMMGPNREESLNLVNCNSKHNLSQQNQIQSGSNSAKLIGDPTSPKNLISKESSSRLSRQQSSQKNLIQKAQNGQLTQQQQQLQYYSKSPPKQRDSISLSKENQDNSGYLNQFAMLNNQVAKGGTSLVNEKYNLSLNPNNPGSFRNTSGNLASFSPMNSRDNFFKKKNAGSQIPVVGSTNRSQSVTPDKYFSSNSHKSQIVNPPSSQNTLEAQQDSQKCFNFESITNSNQYGVLILSLIDIFREIQNVMLVYFPFITKLLEESPNNQFLLRCSYVEIYTDFVYDLLKPQEKLTETLSIGEDYNKEFYIKGATEEIVSSIEEIIQLLKYGEHNRHYASTAMNHISSRSHTIFRMYVRTMPKEFTNGNEGITESILNFVDLAGSEKISIHNSQGKGSLNNLYTVNNANNVYKDRTTESKTINKSLFFLTQVISLKSQGKQEAHIPYRNSPLTKILRSSLGGNSRTAIILCLNPCLSQLEQSISTLRFGQNAKKIENQVKQNVIQVQNNDILQDMIKEYETRIVELESEQNVSKVNSDNLVKMIQTLIEQKNNLEKRIKAKELFDQQHQGQRQIFFNKKRKNNKQDFIHLDNVGLIKVFDDSWEYNSENSYSSRDVSKEIQGNKCAMRKIKNMNEQKKVLEDQVERLKHSLLLKENDQAKMMQRLDKKLAGKKRKLQTLKANKITLGIENSRLKQELGLYKNQNIEGLKKLSISKLEKLEQNVELLLKNIRFQKSALALVSEFEGDPSIIQRINKTLQIRGMMDCELVELANDFFEPNLQLNTTLQDEDDSLMYADATDNYCFHNIHSTTIPPNIASDLPMNNNNYTSEQQKILQQVQATATQKNKFIHESPLLLGFSPRDTTSCLSYKAEDQYLFNNNTTQTQQSALNQPQQTTSLQNLTYLQNTQRYGNSKTHQNNGFSNLSDNQISSNSLSNQNFGSFQNYFNQVSNNQRKQQLSNQQNTVGDMSNLDSEGYSNRFGINNNVGGVQQTNINQNIQNGEISRSSCSYSDNGKMLVQDLQNMNNGWNAKLYSQEDQFGEKQFQQQQKYDQNKNSVTSPSQNNIMTYQQLSSNEIYPSNSNLMANGVLFNSEESTSQMVSQNQLPLASGKVLNSEANYDNSAKINTMKSKTMTTNNTLPAEIKSGSVKVNLDTQQTINTQYGQSPKNINYQKVDSQQRSCSQGPNSRTNQYYSNDINTEASALTQDFQEPIYSSDVRNYSSQHKNRWESQKNKARLPSKDIQFESVETKYCSSQTQVQQINQPNQAIQNPPLHQSNNSESGFSEKKLVEKLFGKENKCQGENSSQVINKQTTGTRDGTLRTSNLNQNSQQKYQQQMKKTLSQKDILGSKLQIIMNQSNTSSISNATYAQLALQHQQNRNVVQQLMGNTATRSNQQNVNNTNQPIQTPSTSPKHYSGHLIPQNNNYYNENTNNYIKLDSATSYQRISGLK